MPNMATSSTCSLQFHFLSKRLPHESGQYNVPFPESILLKNEYVYEDFKNKVQREAREGTNSFVNRILAAKALTIMAMNDEEIGFFNHLTRFYVTRSLEQHSFVFKVMLHRIDLTREKDREKHASLQDLENAIHKAQEVINEHKYLAHKVSFNSDEQDANLFNVLDMVRKEKENANFKMTDEDYVLLKSDTAQLCALLGLKLDFLDGFDEMPSEHRHHRTMADWIKITLKENTVRANENYLSKEMLESIGFDPLSRAIDTIMIRSEFQGTKEQHIEASEWAQLYVEDEFKYNPLLSRLKPRFPFNFSLTNTWFTLPNIPDEERESNVNLCQLKIMNLATKKSQACSNAKTELSASLPQGDQNMILYHGTDHESARQILLRGIYLSASRQKRDFTCGKGFYLTNNIDDAWNWAKSLTARPAILCFAVSREYLDQKPRKLNLNENEVEWKKMVSLFRNDRITAKILENLNSYDLIEGPMAMVTRTETSDELECKPKPSSYQMCLISDDFAEDFEKNLHSTIFFDIS